MALVMVLGFVALIAILVTAFFSSATTELASSKSYSDGSAVKGLSDSAVSSVMGIIREATSGGSKVAWASQPGMLRTYDDSGKLLSIYKLYSSAQMTMSNFDLTEDLDTSWRDKPGLFTDLNKPISIISQDGSATLRYPIVDPAAADPKTGVEGFSLVNAPGYDSAKAAAPNNNPAPMPVKWIYILRDGTMAVPDKFDSKTGIASFTTEPKPTKANPIVGRMAFWTDDETAKVNINTASEGTYWDTPRVATQEDYGSYSNLSINGMATRQPAQKEYQRYPGHPATTCLSSVLGSLFSVSAPYPISASSSDAMLLDPYYSITPRIGREDGTSGGSRAGTVVPPSVVSVDHDRLYATVDELVFNPVRKSNFTPGTLEKVRFFLTASSSAPETTIFNTPRISMWPVWLDAAKRTTSDKLLAFCSTIGGKNYFFTRTNAKSGTEDFSLRNAALYKYLQLLTSRKIPGFGGDFLSKLGADRDQVLTSIYDYIRCTNLSDSSAGAYPFTPQFNASAVTSDASTANYTIGAGQVTPIKITSGGATTRGFGRMHTVSGAALVFYATGADSNNRVNKMQAVFLPQFACPMHGSAGMMPNMKLVMPAKAGEGLNLFQAKGKTSATYKPLGFPQGGANFIENADVSTWAGRSVGGVESPAMAITTTWSNKAPTGKKIDQGFAPGSAGKAQRGIYPFVTGQDFVLDNPASDTTFNFKGGNVTLEIRTQDTDELIQTLHFTFPDGEFKTPAMPSNTAHTNYNTRLASGGGLQSGSAPILVLPQDTAIQVETAGAKGNANDTSPDATAGDYRMIASLADVPASKFRPHMDYSTTGVQHAHSLYMAFGAGFNGAKLGKLVSVTNYSNDAWHKPHVPSRVGTAVTRTDASPGDWDTGWGDEPDGAYLNKSDDGDLSGQGANIHLAYTLGYPTQVRPSGDTYFSPNRQVPSPLMFGSIPTGVQRMQPWQTLLFHPRPEDTKHPGKISPRDHLIADFFWMPVVEPYAISQPFSTAGKINLNYQIVPFSHIKRSTGLHAVMKSTRFLALSLADGPGYKLTVASNGQLNFTLGPRRLPINASETLRAFDVKFASKDTSSNFFKSASQICEMNLVPAGTSTSYTSDDASMATFWNNYKLTGDNVKEKPYVDIYPRLTTKSNTYTVHVWVETLNQGVPKNAAEGDAQWAQWNENKGQVTAQYRGSTLIERYIDPQDPRLASFDENYTGPTIMDTEGNITKAGSLDPFYRFRVLNTKRFDR